MPPTANRAHSRAAQPSLDRARARQNPWRIDDATSYRPGWLAAVLTSGILACVVLLPGTATAIHEATVAGPHGRQPIKIIMADGQILVANHRSGTVSTLAAAIDLADAPAAQLGVIREIRLTDRLDDLWYLPQSRRLVACDASRGELITAQLHATGEIVVTSRIPVPAGPVTLVELQGDTPRIALAHRWARRLTIWRSNAQSESAWELQSTIRLPFAPRALAVAPDGRHVVISDATGPLLAVADMSTSQLRHVVRLPGHNHQSLAISPDGKQLVVAHLLLNDFVPSTRDHVFWGNVVSSVLRTIPLSSIVTDGPTARSDATRIHGSLYPLGQENDGAGDPRTIALDPRGGILIALAGTHQIAYRRPGERRFRRVRVDRHPAAILPVDSGRYAWVASQFEDSIQVIDLEAMRVIARGELGPREPITPAARGEQLFYDATLALHGWFSCHSCHPFGHTCDLRSDNFGDGTVGAPKRIPSLLGVGATGPWAWDGSQHDLQAQVAKSLSQTMHGPAVPQEDVAALVAFLNTLPLPPQGATGTLPAPKAARPTETAQRDGDRQTDVAAGRRLFDRYECNTCHAGPQYTSTSIYDVGLRDELGHAEFNPPSLRGVSQRFRFLHDGRAASLDEVLRVHPEPGLLDEAERLQVRDFLNSL